MIKTVRVLSLNPSYKGFLVPDEAQDNARMAGIIIRLDANLIFEIVFKRHTPLKSPCSAALSLIEVGLPCKCGTEFCDKFIIFLSIKLSGDIRIRFQDKKPPKGLGVRENHEYDTT